jgi:hypothetical protein
LPTRRMQEHPLWLQFLYFGDCQPFVIFRIDTK